MAKPSKSGTRSARARRDARWRKRKAVAEAVAKALEDARRVRFKGGKKWQGSKWIRAQTRHAIYHRDGQRCVYCSRAEQLSLDHLLPEELGGTHATENLVTACKPCNDARGCKTLRAWLKYLRGRGVDTSKMARRIRRLTKKPLDRAEGRRLALEAGKRIR